MNKEELLLEQWKMAGELHRHEDNLTLTRFSYFVTLNAILLSVFVALAGNLTSGNIDTKVALVITSVFGAVASLAWYFMQLRANLYTRYRKEQAKATEKQLLINGERVLTLYEAGLDDQEIFEIPKRERWSMGVNTHRVIILISLFAAVFWVCAFIYFCFLRR